MEDLLKPGHLTRLLEEELTAEVDALSLGEVTSDLTQLLGGLRTHRDTCPPHQLQVGEDAQYMMYMRTHAQHCRTWTENISTN